MAIVEREVRDHGHALRIASHRPRVVVPTGPLHQDRRPSGISSRDDTLVAEIPYQGVQMGCSTCVEPEPGMAEQADLDIRPSLREHRQPDTSGAVAIAALMAEPVRAGILVILRDGPHCVCEMAAALDVKQNNLSNHLARLRAAGLVRASRHKADARWKYYERDEEAVRAASETLAGVL